MICDTDGMAFQLGSHALIWAQLQWCRSAQLKAMLCRYLRDHTCEHVSYRKKKTSFGLREKRRLRIINKNVAKANGQGWDWLCNGQRVEHNLFGLRCLEYKQHGQQEATLLLAVFV